MSSKTPRFKRLYLINRDFQLRYTKIAVLVAVVSTCLTVGLLLFPLFQFGILRFPNFLPYPFLLAIVVASILNFLIIAWTGVILTHRIAGPMYSIVRHMKLMQLGQWRGSLRVRQSDDLKYLVRNINELIDYLTALAEQDKSRVDGIIATLRLSPGANEGAVREALTRAEELRLELERRTQPPAPSPEPAKDGLKEIEIA